MGYTSSAVKRKYNQKVYTRISADVPKELAEQFKSACKLKGVSYAQVLKDAMQNFIEKQP